jgi:hypothetical protein
MLDAGHTRTTLRCCEVEAGAGAGGAAPLAAEWFSNRAEASGEAWEPGLGPLEISMINKVLTKRLTSEPFLRVGVSNGILR